MYKHRTVVHVHNLSAHAVYDFMLHCTDEQYAKWWPGIHIAFHTIQHRPNDIGSLVYFDEMVGRRRLRHKGFIAQAVPDRKISWQIKGVVRLPAYLTLDLEDTAGVVKITHVLSIGYDTTFSKIFIDPVARLYFNKKFESDLAKHVETEFSKLAEILI